jgi:NitT/TauT family transport system substrate-binding protein
MVQKISFLCTVLLLVFIILPDSAVSDDEKTLRIALLPIPDVLPVYVAEEKGYFKELGVEVEMLPVGSAVERDQLLQAGQVDGMINEISGAANFNRDGAEVKIVAIARSPEDKSPLFRILAAPGSGISAPEQLSGVAIGISKNTVIEYVSSRLLSAAGLGMDEISYTSIPVLPERLQLLLSGQVKAVTLPDPLAAAALKAGATEVVSDLALPEVSASVVTFSSKSLENKKQAVKNFMIAWDRAAADLNSDPAAYRQLMLKKIRVPKNVQQDFTIPPMSRKTLPSRAQWDDVMDWMMDKKLLTSPLPYEDSVTAEFLAK